MNIIIAILDKSFLIEYLFYLCTQIVQLSFLLNFLLLSAILYLFIMIFILLNYLLIDVIGLMIILLNIVFL